MIAIAVKRYGCKSPIPPGIPQYFKQGRLNVLEDVGEKVVVVTNENGKYTDENYVLNCPAYKPAAIAKAKGKE